ncbi:hypothetical protein I4U23_026116 [Adineta vaga]|nr:hypothetical protein I4U23_026116 [Adineta vaga]
MHTHQSQASTMIPSRYRTLLYLSIFLLVIDLGINASSEYLAEKRYGQLIIFIVQDVCILLSITLLLMMVLTTYIAQAGLLCLLLRMFRFAIITSSIYFVLCTATQVLILLPRFQNEETKEKLFSRKEVLILYVIQRTFSAIYYYTMKRAVYRLSDPHFYQSSKWLQKIWEQRRTAFTGVTMNTVSNLSSGMPTTRCICCVIQ